MSATNAYGAADRLLRYWTGEWKAEGMHGAPQLLIDTFAEQMGLTHDLSRGPIRASLQAHVTDPMYLASNAGQGWTQLTVVEAAIDNARLWLRDCAPKFEVGCYVHIPRSELRRMECDLQELFMEALYS